MRFALIVLALFAASNLGRFRDWPDSPQGYFLTKAERAEWATLTTEGEAERFVNDFLARRGAGFAADVAEAAKAADENLTVAKRPGSKTLRGKVVILLGPPSGFTVAQAKLRAGQSMDDYQSHQRSGRPHTLPVGTSYPPATSELRTKFSTDYTFTYAREKLPGTPAQDRVIVVSVNPTTGEDRILDARMAREVGELLELAAETRAKNGGG